ncbi:MAG: PLP-dependent aminotransferase family protein [Rhizobiales bacterium]|nr:PLP-dependent aminotransferase family protein [Hyphomicrobiales bacterium]
MERPQYISIVRALERDVSQGLVQPGVKLPARRVLAQRLRVSLGTITKAYEEAESRGLVAGEIGRGTFVVGDQSQAEQSRPANEWIDLSINASPDCGEAEILSQAMMNLGRGRGFAKRLEYHSQEGASLDIASVETWLRSLNVDVDAGAVCLCNGAQHAISIAVKAAIDLTQGAILTEAACYAGLKNIARFENLELVGIGMDEDGIRPDLLEAELARTGCRLLYLTPSLHTPTAMVMSEARRREIVEIAKRNDVFIIEDDSYGFLFQDKPTSLQSLAPERVFYLSSFSKITAPALRLGAMIVPRKYQDRARLGLASTGLMTSPLLSGVLSNMLEDGSLQDIVEKKRRETKARLDVARHLFPHALPGKNVSSSFNIWIPFPNFERVFNVFSVAAAGGILLAAPDVFRVSADAPVGLRVSLGGPQNLKSLTSALEKLKDLIASKTFQSVI